MQSVCLARTGLTERLKESDQGSRDVMDFKSGKEGMNLLNVLTL